MYKTTRRHIPEASKVRSYRRGNCNSRKKKIIFFQKSKQIYPFCTQSLAEVSSNINMYVEL